MRKALHVETQEFTNQGSQFSGFSQIFTEKLQFKFNLHPDPEILAIDTLIPKSTMSYIARPDIVFYFLLIFIFPPCIIFPVI